MDDRRQHSRHATELHIEVFDLHSGRRLGRVVDLSADGFMLFSESPLENDSVWECRLTVEPPVDDIHEIRLGADCLWSRPGANNQNGWSGFHIIDLADEQASALEVVLQHI
ncbi:PilZ domain-containing protein [Aquipseudomonas ullengensis]|uniref:PilZ domain-containing protein n=1 Tax=Aquipseudomonas ullengensis TaxID=2759166 RepID=A0A7W4QAF7_9GAMM|nr:PilZ domain-containing protein [Pseudomonas ullengensis]MBB2495420.1 PilZ domain-containing protein [Pseudomonas ullengensis]